jgi:hypothetical protein
MEGDRYWMCHGTIQQAVQGKAANNGGIGRDENYPHTHRIDCSRQSSDGANIYRERKSKPPRLLQATGGHRKNGGSTPLLRVL